MDCVQLFVQLFFRPLINLIINIEAILLPKFVSLVPLGRLVGFAAFIIATVMPVVLLHSCM